ncbi:hypothetical protein CPB83DRAFT_791760 [Crepidotus variabilis]|uniref:F-box domain-containing protein n=1 Tax=Crepidotus variabilis TaxID=179855 RepID=A0A9P6JPP9_9AGAR|nr:hypothetical protein CPB83DRAFT_791760 [Crepidotus variabilis]
MPLPPTFSSLGEDVMINVLAFLGPTDIIAIGRTCKTFRSATARRVVWLEAVRGMMYDHGIPSRTYPLDALDVPSLIHIALSPLKFARRILNIKEDSPLDPSSAWVFLYRLDKSTLKQFSLKNVSESYSYDDVYLVPGGRFVLTMRRGETLLETPATLLQLWDIGIPGSRQDIAHLAGVTYPVTVEDFSRYAVAPSTDGNGLFLITETRENEQIILSVHLVHPFGPPSTPIAVNKLALGVSHPVISWAISDTRMATAEATGRVVVWDFVSGKSAAWSVGIIPDVASQDDTLRIHLHGNDVFLAWDANLFQWGIPEMTLMNDLKNLKNRRPLFTFTNLFVKDDENISHLAPPPFIDNHSTYVGVQSPWSSQFAHSRFMLITRGSNLALYKMQAIENTMSCQGELPTILPTRVAVSDDFSGVSSTTALWGLRRCQDDQIFVSMEDSRSPLVHLVSTSGPQNSGAISGVRLSLGIAATVLQVSICPATGRLCVLTHEGDILIVDYLSHS